MNDGQIPGVAYDVKFECQLAHDDKCKSMYETRTPSLKKTIKEKMKEPMRACSRDKKKDDRGFLCFCYCGVLCYVLCVKRNKAQ